MLNLHDALQRMMLRRVTADFRRDNSTMRKGKLHVCVGKFFSLTSKCRLSRADGRYASQENANRTPAERQHARTRELTIR